MFAREAPSLFGGPIKLDAPTTLVQVSEGCAKLENIRSCFDYMGSKTLRAGGKGNLPTITSQPYNVDARDKCDSFCYPDCINITKLPLRIPTILGREVCYAGNHLIEAVLTAFVPEAKLTLEAAGRERNHGFRLSKGNMLWDAMLVSLLRTLGMSGGCKDYNAFRAKIKDPAVPKSSGTANVKFIEGRLRKIIRPWNPYNIDEQIHFLIDYAQNFQTTRSRPGTTAEMTVPKENWFEGILPIFPYDVWDRPQDFDKSLSKIARRIERICDYFDPVAVEHLLKYETERGPIHEALTLAYLCYDPLIRIAGFQSATDTMRMLQDTLERLRLDVCRFRYSKRLEELFKCDLLDRTYTGTPCQIFEDGMSHHSRLFSDMTLVITLIEELALKTFPHLDNLNRYNQLFMYLPECHTYLNLDELNYIDKYFPHSMKDRTIRSPSIKVMYGAMLDVPLKLKIGIISDNQWKELFFTLVNKPTAWEAVRNLNSYFSHIQQAECRPTMSKQTTRDVPHGTAKSIKPAWLADRRKVVEPKAPPAALFDKLGQQMPTCAKFGRDPPPPSVRSHDSSHDSEVPTRPVVSQPKKRQDGVDTDALKSDLTHDKIEELKTRFERNVPVELLIATSTSGQPGIILAQSQKQLENLTSGTLDGDDDFDDASSLFSDLSCNTISGYNPPILVPGSPKHDVHEEGQSWKILKLSTSQHNAIKGTVSGEFKNNFTLWSKRQLIKQFRFHVRTMDLRERQVKQYFLFHTHFVEQVFDGHNLGNWSELDMNRIYACTVLTRDTSTSEEFKSSYLSFFALESGVTYFAAYVSNAVWELLRDRSLELTDPVESDVVNLNPHHTHTYTNCNTTHGIYDLIWRIYSRYELYEKFGKYFRKIQQLFV